MPNRNYLAGTRLERTRKRYYESIGYLVTRSSGSHGPWDLTVVDPLNGDVFLIQCKRVQNMAQANAEARKFVKTLSPKFHGHSPTVCLEVQIKGSTDVWGWILHHSHEFYNDSEVNGGR